MNMVEIEDTINELLAKKSYGFAEIFAIDDERYRVEIISDKFKNKNEEKRKQEISEVLSEISHHLVDLNITLTPLTIKERMMQAMWREV